MHYFEIKVETPEAINIDVAPGEVYTRRSKVWICAYADSLNELGRFLVGEMRHKQYEPTLCEYAPDEWHWQQEPPRYDYIPYGWYLLSCDEPDEEKDRMNWWNFHDLVDFIESAYLTPFGYFVEETDGAAYTCLEFALYLQALTNGDVSTDYW